VKSSTKNKLREKMTVSDRLYFEQKIKMQQQKHYEKLLKFQTKYNQNETRILRFLEKSRKN
jgi:hypothetical protein